MIDLSKAYERVKKYISKIEELKNNGVYFYIELSKVYAFFSGKSKDECLEGKVLTVNKEGGKVNTFRMIEFENYFYDYNYNNLIEIDNPDYLGDVIIVNNPVSNVKEILDLNFKDEITRRDFLFNLVEEGESCRTVEKIIKSGITLDNIKKMDIDGFSVAYGIRKKELYSKIYSLSKKELANNDLSIYALYSRGVSGGILDRLVELGIDKCYKLYLVPREIFATKYSLLEATADKIYDAFEIMNFELAHDSKTLKFIQELLVDSNYRKMVKAEIHRIVSQSEKEIKPLILKSNINDKYSQIPILNELINEMIKDKIISLNEFGLKANIIRLKDYLNYLPDNSYTELARKYFLDDTSTYESLGEPLGISRERVRQILKKIPIAEVFEDSYGELFKKYDFSDKAFMYLFNENRYVYKYLLYKFDKKGNEKLEVLLEDDSIDEGIKHKLEELFKDKYLFIDGSKVYKSKTVLLQYYMKENVRQLTSINEIWNGFKIFINNIIPDLKEVGFDPLDDVRDVESPITSEHFPSLKTNGHKYKYYDINSSEIKYLLENMDLNQYKDIEISSKYLFDLHSDLMKEFDIDDQYVLHNLLKKVYKKDDVDYQRSPYIVFGKGDRDKQIDKLILEHAPILTTDLSKIYCDMYGGHLGTIKSYIETHFKELINNQMINLDYSTILPQDELDKFRFILCSKEMWFKEDIYDVCRKNNIVIPKNLFAWQNLEKIGFKNASNYIYSNKYESMKEYLEINYFSSDFLDTTVIDRRLLYVVLFSGLVIEKRKNLEIIEYETGKFMKSKLLEKAGVSIKYLKEFINSVSDFTVRRGLFTFKSIMNDGYTHELFDLGFEEVFYSSILRSDDRFVFKRYGTQTLFENDSNIREISVSNLLEKILFTYRKMEEYDMAVYLYKRYGIDYRDNYVKLQDYAKKSTVYYDKYTDTYYYDYDVYYEEI